MYHMINVEKWNSKKRDEKLFIFRKSLQGNKSLKVIRFVCVIYCFINTFERNLFSIGAFNFPQTDPQIISSGFQLARPVTTFPNTNLK